MMSWFYRLRWQVELIFRYTKTILRLSKSESNSSPFLGYLVSGGPFWSRHFLMPSPQSLLVCGNPLWRFPGRASPTGNDGIQILR
jgi:hypothetical protein